MFANNDDNGLGYLGYAFCDALNGKVLYAIMAALTAVYLGSMIGAMLAFLRSRYMTRDLVNLFARRYPIVRAADTGRFSRTACI